MLFQKRTETPASSAAMVMVARNEERFIRENLIYHRSIGFECCYLFLHQSTDRTEDYAREFPWVNLYQLTGIPHDGLNYISEIHRVAMDAALKAARQDEFEWLLMIDADEFVIPSLDPEKEKTGLSKDFHLDKIFETVPDWAIQIRLKTFETAPAAKAADRKFYENDIFIGSTQFIRHLSPIDSEERTPWSGNLGHSEGQCFVRVNAPVRAYDSHRWTIAQDTKAGERPRSVLLPTVTRGCHAHFYIGSVNHWFEKFSKHNDYPMHWPGEDPTPLETPVKLWRESVANESSMSDRLNSYCRNTVFLGESHIKAGIRTGKLFRHKGLKSLIKQSVQDVGNSLSLNENPNAGKAEELDLSKPRRGPKNPGSTKRVYWSPTLLEDKALSGFFDREEHEGRLFRWSEPVSEITGLLEQGRYSAQLEIRFPIPLQRISVTKEDHLLRVEKIGSTRFRFEFIMVESAELTLRFETGQVGSKPLEKRTLAIPWVQLVFERKDL